MNRLTDARRTQIIAALVDGASVRATGRITGAAKGTILKLLADAGAACLDYQRARFVRLPCKRLQLDEIWSFVGAKQRNVPREERGRGRGDVWTWTAICADTKLVPCWHVGSRDVEAWRMFVEDLAGRMAGRVQITSDAWKAYAPAVENAFGWNGADYMQLIKIYGPAPEALATKRYSPAECIGIEKQRMMGKPNPDHVSTSYVERQNLNMRMQMRRFTRLTNAFSKKIENHMHAVSLHFMAYHYTRPHGTLTKAAKGIHTTPAMAAGLTDHVWKMQEIAEMIL